MTLIGTPRILNTPYCDSMYSLQLYMNSDDLRVGPEPGGVERAGDPCRTVVVLGPRPGGVSVGDGGQIGDRVGDRFPDGGEVHFHASDSSEGGVPMVT